VPRTLVITNDFPPRRGGIESFVLGLCEQLPADQVVVYTAGMPGAADVDATLPFPVVRDPAGTLLPLPYVGRRAAELLGRHGCDRVLFGASAPLGLLAGGLRASGARRIVALSHGHETWWAKVPGTRSALSRIAAECDVLTYVSQWCGDQIASALLPAAAARMRRLSPGVDVERFRPGCGGAQLRGELGLEPDQPLVVCAARMVARKGHDTLVRSWPSVRAQVPSAVLLLVGDGPHRPAVERAARAIGGAGSVVFAGGVPWPQLPRYLDAADVFAMPCRSRLGGLESEALGIVCLEAAATELPVLVGDSGGASETVRHGETGYVVDPYNPAAVAAKLVPLLTQPERARAMGRQGRAWMQESWTWLRAGQRLAKLLVPG
jgi:phosphatidyl-myo-inositol dimannoside synthase